jgi:uncharacterized linocin/CFP29 family protein
MSHLLRELGPISTSGWKAVDDEASSTLKHFLSARKLVEFQGPLGWDLSAESLGRIVVADEGPADGVRIGIRQVQPLVEVRTDFEVSRLALEAVDRGDTNPDLSSVADAAHRAALAEDRIVYYGLEAAGIPGIITSSPYEPLVIGEDYAQYPQTVALALATLRDAGIGGPYGIALGDRCFTGVTAATDSGGYPVLKLLRQVVDGPIVWAPAVDGAVVLSLRGADYAIVCGEDLSIGYLAHSAGGDVRLYVEESLTFRVHEPEAAVSLVYK